MGEQILNIGPTVRYGREEGKIGRGMGGIISKTFQFAKRSAIFMRIVVVSCLNMTTLCVDIGRKGH